MPENAQTPRAGRSLALLLSLVMAAGLLSISTSARAGRAWHVSPSGSDTAAGTEQAPLRTMTAAFKQLRAGDSLLVRGGTYEENVKVSASPGSAAAPVTVRAYQNERPVIRGLLWLTAPSHWSIRGINVTWNQANTSRDHMVKITGGTGWELADAEVWGARSYSGILVAGEPSGFRLANLYVHDTYATNGTNQDHLIYVNAGNGGGVVERNLLVASSNGRAVKIGPPSKDKPGTSNVVVRYNTMVENAGPSNVQIAWGSSNNRIERNIMVRPAANRSAVTAHDISGSGNVVADNLAWDTPRVLDTDDPGLVDGGGNRLEDPRFADPQRGDYRPTNPAAAGYGHLAGTSGDSPPPSSATAAPATATPSTTASPPSTTSAPTPTPTTTPTTTTAPRPGTSTPAPPGSDLDGTPGDLDLPVPGVVSFVGSTQGANHAAGSLVLTTPASASPGDLLVASIDVRGRPAIAAPPGWRLVSFDRAGNALTKATYVRAHSGGISADSFTFSSQQAAAGVILAYSNADIVEPVGDTAAAVSERTKDLTAPSVTVEARAARVLALFGVANKGWIDQPDGFTERADVANATSNYFVTSEASDRVFERGETGVLSAQSRHAGQGVAHVLVLRAAL